MPRLPRNKLVKIIFADSTNLLGVRENVSITEPSLAPVRIPRGTDVPTPILRQGPGNIIRVMNGDPGRKPE